ncbi:hypothetical protein RJ641_011818 [Dillenia turbinata]|uniref:Uncharacterized protein n=1 Tax=Dillenia turbinata TaxID=194707 RepID=A0AAN8UZ73_9MAGN
MEREFKNREIKASEMEEKKKDCQILDRRQVGVVTGALNLALQGFGGLGLSKGGHLWSLRVLFGGWMAMGVTFGLTKLIGSTGL